MEPDEMPPLCGGITQVRGFENNLEIEGLARFAIDQHNTKQNALLEFKRVVNAKEQVVAGSMYYITLEATDGGKTKIYEAKIWEQPWIDFKEVMEFKHIEDAAAAYGSDG
ncbi:Cysteine proteinase inhibitor-like protein [Drosera capensis]